MEKNPNHKQNKHFLGVSILKLIPVILLLAFLANSCKKETLSQYSTKREGGIDQVSIQIIEGRLYFPTLENLDSVLEFMGNFEDTDFLDWDEYYACTSWRESVDYDDSQIPDQDKIIGTLFNENQLLQVGEWVLKIASSNLQAATYEAFQESGEFVWEESETLTFTIDQDIWDELFPEENQSVINACNESNRSDQTAQNIYAGIIANDNYGVSRTWGLKPRIVFKNSYWGIYKALGYQGQVVYEYNNAYYPATTQVYPQGNYSVVSSNYLAKGKQKCMGCLTFWRDNNNKRTWTNPKGFNAQDWHFEDRHYCRTRALHYHKSRVSLKLIIGAEEFTSLPLTMVSWGSSSCTF